MAIDSRDLRHFPEKDATTVNAKQAQRDKISSQVEQYLAQGGEISTHDHTSNSTWDQPVRRNRKDQIAHMRKQTMSRIKE